MYFKQHGTKQSMGTEASVIPLAGSAFCLLAFMMLLPLAGMSSPYFFGQSLAQILIPLGSLPDQQSIFFSYLIFSFYIGI